jgi:hypothetical protein
MGENYLEYFTNNVQFINRIQGLSKKLKTRIDVRKLGKLSVISILVPESVRTLFEKTVCEFNVNSVLE